MGACSRAGNSRAAAGEMTEPRARAASSGSLPPPFYPLIANVCVCVYERDTGRTHITALLTFRQEQGASVNFSLANEVGKERISCSMCDAAYTRQ